ncbi:MAG: hypothetical protein ACD_21C00250G0004 [uncultured bacterium]|nr:MAG: hypothetical protein ACD_21C00250G0004 [uncultured bacterium]
MINHAMFNEVWGRFDSQHIPFLTRLKQKMETSQPYKGLKIFHNIPLTFETVIKVDSLLLGGADVVVSGVSVISPNKAAMGFLERANVKVDLDKKIDGGFNAYLDCGAELLNFPAPSLGTVELTQTGSVIYRDHPIPHSYPVISIDDSPLKHLETIGTGHSCVEAVSKLTKQPIDNKKFMVFGYGKVGRGIVKALKNYTNEVVVVESDQKLINTLAKMNLNVINASSVGDIKRELADTHCVITATGKKGCVSEILDREDLAGIHLANAGVEDEFGAKFTTDDVLYAKQPVNFSLDVPTVLHYLDPVLYAHNIALDLLIANEFPSGYHQFPDYLAKEIMQEWEQLHDADLEEMLAI